MSPLVGIFVGGRARRMGGVAKGLLPTADGRSVVERLLAEIREALPGAPIALVGAASSYDAFELPTLADTPPGIGPLGGLRALLARTAELGLPHALALACDLPTISANLIRRLADAEPAASAVAPREPGGPWYALSARYAVTVLPVLDAQIADGQRALQRLFAQLGPSASELALTAPELALLADWDRPEDLGG
jgi:molybdopterin-guanine dinucleotide biosynthesis protein A